MISFNSFVRIYLKRYNKVLEGIRHQSPELQSQELNRIVNYSVLQNVKSVHDFYNTTPSTYGDYQSDIEQRFSQKTGRFKTVNTFAKTAGTTGSSSKYIPTSAAFLQRNHVSAGWLTMAIMYRLRSDMDIISKKNLLVGGAIYEKNEDYTIADISGLLINKIPKLFHPYHLPTIAEATMSNWEKKLAITASKAAQSDEVVMFAGVPTWILTLAKEVLSITGKKSLIDVWPHLKVYLHGGVKMEPYLTQFEQLIPKSSGVLFLEVYNASEGFFAVQDTPINEGLLLLTAHGIYYEFIPINDYHNGNYNIIPLGKVRCHEEYVILITNLSGLCRYIVGDTVMFTCTQPYRLNVLGRINEYINAFGEDLSLDHVNNAISFVSMQHNVYIRDFTVAPKYISLDAKGCHQWYIEFEKVPNNLDIFTIELDLEIQKQNFNYRQKRSDDLALSCIEIIPLQKGFFDAFAKSKGKYGGQNKLPKLRNDRSLVDEIEEVMRKGVFNKELYHL